MTENINQFNQKTTSINPTNTQPPSIPPFNPNPSSSKKILIIGFIVFLVLFGFLAFFAEKLNQRIDKKRLIKNTQNLIPSPSASPLQKYEKIVVQKKPPAELYMDIKNQLIKIFEEK